MRTWFIGVSLIFVVLVSWLVWRGWPDSDPSPQTPQPTVTQSKNGAPNAPLPTGQPLPFPLTVSEGFTIGLFADNLQEVRDLVFSPGQTLLASVSAAGQVIALPDRDRNGQADEPVIVLDNLENPHGLAFQNGQLFVAEETRVRRYDWQEDTLQANLDTQILDLPTGGRHDTRSLVFDSQGKLYVSLGSTCDTCQESEPWIATVIQTDADGNNPQVYASGLRNAVFLTLRPQTDEVWVTEMGRDNLGPETPPDEINRLQSGGNYGWPKCYGNQVYDQEFSQGSPEECQATLAPVMNLPAHSAPLGLKFLTAANWPEDWQGNLFVAYHGSWNRNPPREPKVVRLSGTGTDFTESHDFITGWYRDGSNQGRPVDLEMNEQGQMYISDDYAGNVYLVTPQP